MKRGPIGVYLLLLATGLAIGSYSVNVWRLRTFRVSAPLDMAYYNQQLWGMCRGLDSITVRPQNAYAVEGPQPWRTNHLRPITWAFVPLYSLWPAPELLYLVQAIVLASGVWVAYRLGAIHGGTKGGALAAFLYATTPPLWLLGCTDFRYMYLGIPVGLWFAERLHAGSLKGTLGTGILWMTVREPYSIVAAAFGTGELLRWPYTRRWLPGAIAILLGVAWFWLHVAYLAVAYGPETAGAYLWAVRHPTEAYGMVENAVVRSLQQEWLRLLVNFGPLVLLCLVAPRYLFVGVPLLFPPMRMGLFTLHPAVQYVRYVAPGLVVLLAGACLATGRFCSSKSASLRRIGRVLLVGNTLSTVIVLTVGPSALVGASTARDGIVRLPSRLDESARLSELDELLRAIPRSEGVLAARSVLANLSPRDKLYDYYQPGPGLSWRDVLSDCAWIVVEKRVLLLVAPQLMPLQRDLVWETIRRVAGATGVRDRQTWTDFATTVTQLRTDPHWETRYSDTNVLILRRRQ